MSIPSTRLLQTLGHEDAFVEEEDEADFNAPQIILKSAQALNPRRAVLVRVFGIEVLELRWPFIVVDHDLFPLLRGQLGDAIGVLPYEPRVVPHRRGERKR